MVEQYATSEEFWAKYDVQPSWAYFGAHDGLYTAVPAIYQKACGELRSSPSSMVSGRINPKDVVLVIDINVLKSMFRYGRMNITRDAAETIVDTRGAVHDLYSRYISWLA
jgi:hypothetical protein